VVFFSAPAISILITHWEVLADIYIHRIPCHTVDVHACLGGGVDIRIGISPTPSIPSEKSVSRCLQTSKKIAEQCGKRVEQSCYVMLQRYTTCILISKVHLVRKNASNASIASIASPASADFRKNL
jgi:hypothetical protein